MLKVTKKHLYVVPVLLSTLDILEFLSRIEAPLKMNEISSATGVSLTTTYRILQTLVHRGYLEQNIGGRYSVASFSDLKTAFRRHSNVPQEQVPAA